MAKHSNVHELAVGLIVILAVAILAGGVLILGQETKLFDAKVTYRTNFPDASGLRVGSPVTMSGVRVGSVSRLYLPTDPASAGIEIFMQIDSDYAERVREDTSATPVILQLVANEKAIDLTPGSPDAAPLRQGDFIEPRVPESLLEKGGNIADTVETITGDLREVLSAISRGEGLLGKAIVDPEFGQEGLEQVNEALRQARIMLERINQGRGLVGRALADENFADKVAADLGEAASGVAFIATRIKEGQGVLGELLEPGEQEELVINLARLSKSIEEITRGLEEGRGLAGVLLRDEELAERVARNLDETLARTASITRKIDEGQGTIGLLVNERGLHDDAQQLVRGVRSSKIATWLLRKFYDKGEQDEEGSDAEKLGALAPRDPDAHLGGSHEELTAYSRRSGAEEGADMETPR